MREEIAWPPGPAGQRQGGIDAHGPDGWVRWLETSGLTDWKEERVPCYSVIRGLHVWSVHFHAALSFLSWRCGVGPRRVTFLGLHKLLRGRTRPGRRGSLAGRQGVKATAEAASDFGRRGSAWLCCQLPGSIESGVQLREMRNGGGEVNCWNGQTQGLHVPPAGSLAGGGDRPGDGRGRLGCEVRSGHFPLWGCRSVAAWRVIWNPTRIPPRQKGGTVGQVCIQGYVGVCSAVLCCALQSGETSQRGGRGQGWRRAGGLDGMEA